MHRNARDTGVKVVLYFVAHANDPVGKITWRVERPPDEVDGVVEAVQRR